jgi:hypothetical protein
MDDASQPRRSRHEVEQSGERLRDTRPTPHIEQTKKDLD